MQSCERSEDSLTSVSETTWTQSDVSSLLTCSRVDYISHQPLLSVNMLEVILSLLQQPFTLLPTQEQREHQTEPQSSFIPKQNSTSPVPAGRAGSLLTITLIM